MNFSILQGNALDILSGLSEIISWMGEYVHCVVTSPPYFRKRFYGESDQEIGNEKDVSEYISTIADYFDAIPLHPLGSVWVNLGDKRIGGLSMVPERFALEMIKRKWILLDNVIWAKVVVDNQGKTQGHCMIDPAQGRLNGNGYEYLYRFAKSKKAWTDTCAVRIPRQGVEDIRYLPEDLMKTHTSIEGRNLSNVWRVNMGQSSKKHYAVYPVELCERPIAMTCPLFVDENEKFGSRIVEMEEYDEERSGKRIFGKYTSVNEDGEYNEETSKKKSGRVDSGRTYTPRKPVTKGWTFRGGNPGVVLDPFCGTGTTGEVALKLGRSFIGIDLYQEFVDISIERCNETVKFLKKNNYNPREMVK
jgi:site-specific DNA-methyltransferase (adenine-specific)